MSLFKKIINKFNKKNNNCIDRNIKPDDLKLNDDSLSAYFPEEINWEKEKKDDESTWSNDEKEVLETPILSLEQEDPSENTLVVEETN
ncbi:10699_t:CDS:1, partial [Cetraspora pellucida]